MFILVGMRSLDRILYLFFLRKNVSCQIEFPLTLKKWYRKYIQARAVSAYRDQKILHKEIFLLLLST
jgi:hypothetical protein